MPRGPRSLGLAILLYLLLSPLPSVAFPTALIPLTLGAQWPWGPGGTISPSCQQRSPFGGVHCVRFPEGARLWAIAWSSSVKVPRHEVLFHLIASEDGQLGHGLLSTHHVSITQATLIARTLTLPGPIPIPAGWVVWIYAEGDGDPHPAPVEAQVTLLVEPTAVEIP